MQVCMSHGTHTYSQVLRVPSSFSTSLLAVAYAFQVPGPLSYPRQTCTSTLGGSAPAMRRASLMAVRLACERERPCHSVGHFDAASLTSSFQSPLQVWYHVGVPKPTYTATSSLR